VNVSAICNEKQQQPFAISHKTLSETSEEKLKLLQNPSIAIKLKNQVDGIGFTCWAKQK